MASADRQMIDDATLVHRSRLWQADYSGSEPIKNRALVFIFLSGTYQKRWQKAPFFRAHEAIPQVPDAVRGRPDRPGATRRGVRFCKSPMNAASPKAQPLSAEALTPACSCAPTPACTRAAYAPSGANGVLPRGQYSAWGVSSRSLRKPRQWAWLDQGESAACATSAALMGVRAMYNMKGSR